jgi:endoglucanase
MILLATLLAAAEPRFVIRINQVGYLPDAPKVAVACSLDANPRRDVSFTVASETGRIVQRARSVRSSGSFGPCAETYRLDFTPVSAAGRYVIEAAGVKSPTIRVGTNVYDGGADTLLYYLRQQRSGFNPSFATRCIDSMASSSTTPDGW